MTSHFGAWISAYVDGQLPAARAERLEAHLVVCAQCAGELGDERRARSLLLAARDVAPGPDLTARILAGACDRPPAAPASRRGPHPELRPDTAGRAYPALTGELRRRHRTWRWATAGVVVVGVGVIGLSELGRPPLVSPDPERVAALGTLALAPVPGAVGVAATTGADDVLGRLAHAGWVVPAPMPRGVTLASHGVRDEGLELDLETPAGPVVVVERRGTLATDDAHTTTVLGGRTVYVLSTEPWHVATQVGDVVVEVYAPDDDAAVLDVLASLEGEGRGDIVGRVTRGWSVLTQEISR